MMTISIEELYGLEKEKPIQYILENYGERRLMPDFSVKDYYSMRQFYIEARKIQEEWEILTKDVDNKNEA